MANYQATSYGAQGGMGGGGFMSSQGGNQDTPGSRGKSFANDSLRPVTIRQLLNAQSAHEDAENFQVDGAGITQVTFVGQIQSINTQATNVTYKLDDGTAVIDVKVFVDRDNASTGFGGGNPSDDPSSPDALTKGAYARVWGRLKSMGGKLHVAGHPVVRRLRDLNELQYHLLDATATHLYYTRGPPQVSDLLGQPAGGASGGAGAGAGALGGADTDMNGAAAAGGGGGASTAEAVLRPNTKRVLAALRSAPQSNEGVHAQAVAAQLNLQVNDVLSAGDELVSAGLIYTTLDDETWAVL
ncbi:MAG: hypothetical protein M1825_006522 [Sarcosagium campestre]|nr:MAG: hypothetical protein M1825_006522 [Sarcosagium campestre]